MRPLSIQTKRSYEADNCNRENERPSTTHHRTPVSNWKYSAASAKSKLDEILRGIDQLNTEAFNADNNANTPLSPLSPLSLLRSPKILNACTSPTHFDCSSPRSFNAKKKKIKKNTVQAVQQHQPISPREELQKKPVQQQPISLREELQKKPSILPSTLSTDTSSSIYTQHEEEEDNALDDNENDIIIQQMATVELLEGADSVVENIRRTVLEINEEISDLVEDAAIKRKVDKLTEKLLEQQADKKTGHKMMGYCHDNVDGALRQEDTSAAVVELEKQRRQKEEEATATAAAEAQRKADEAAAAIHSENQGREQEEEAVLILAELERKRIEQEQEAVAAKQKAQEEAERITALNVERQSMKDLVVDIEKLIKEKKNNAYYKILGVESTASLADIKKAYRKRALKLHPDKDKHGCGTDDAFKALAHVYGVVSNEESRQKYDRENNRRRSVSLDPPTQSDPMNMPSKYNTMLSGTRVTIQSRNSSHLNGLQGCIVDFDNDTGLYTVKMDGKRSPKLTAEASKLFQNVMVCLRANMAPELVSGGVFLVILSSYYKDSQGGTYQVMYNTDDGRTKTTYLRGEQFIIPNGIIVRVTSNSYCPDSIDVYGEVVNWREDRYLSDDASYYEVQLSENDVIRVPMANVQL